MRTVTCSSGERAVSGVLVPRRRMLLIQRLVIADLLGIVKHRPRHSQFMPAHEHMLTPSAFTEYSALTGRSRQSARARSRCYGVQRSPTLTWHGPQRRRVGQPNQKYLGAWSLKPLEWQGFRPECSLTHALNTGQTETAGRVLSVRGPCPYETRSQAIQAIHSFLRCPIDLLGNWFPGVHAEVP
jgi:hypothetical protein